MGIKNLRTLGGLLTVALPNRASAIDSTLPNRYNQGMAAGESLKPPTFLALIEVRTFGEPGHHFSTRSFGSSRRAGFFIKHRHSRGDARVWHRLFFNFLFHSPGRLTKSRTNRCAIGGDYRAPGRGGDSPDSAAKTWYTAGKRCPAMSGSIAFQIKPR